MFQELLKLDISYVVNLKNTKQNTGFFVNYDPLIHYLTVNCYKL